MNKNWLTLVSFKEVTLMHSRKYYFLALCEKSPNTQFFPGPYFPIFSSNTGKYGPEKIPYLDTFYVVSRQKHFVKSYNFVLDCFVVASHEQKHKAE